MDGKGRLYGWTLEENTQLQIREGEKANLGNRVPVKWVEARTVMCDGGEQQELLGWVGVR